MHIQRVLVLLLLGTLQSISAQTIHQLAHQGELEKLQKIIEQDKTLTNQSDNRDSTPLHFACDGGHLEVVKFLLSKGADVKARDVDGDRPLSWAALRGHVEVMEALIQTGAPVDSENRQGRSALDWAVLQGHEKAVHLLLDHGALTNVTKEEADIQLHRAAIKGFQRMVDLLMEKGADFKSLNPGEGNILHSAAMGGLKTFMEDGLKKGLDVNGKNIYGTTPLHIAASLGHDDLVMLLLNYNADINAESQSGKRPFHLAVENKHTKISNFLKSKGADTSPWHFPELKDKYFGSKPPKRKPELLLPGIISTEKSNERDVSFSPDFKEFYFTRWFGREWKIMVSKNERTGWTQPESASFSGDYVAAEACVTPDNQQLYFICRRAEEGEKPPIPWRMWFVNRNESGWGEPRSMKEEPFRTGYYPTFTKQAALYFTTAGNDVHMAKREDGLYKTSTKLGDSVNTEDAEYNACIAPDESYLIFTSLGWGEDFGGGDLYICFRKEDGLWTRAKNMGEAVNSPYHDYCPSIAPDGKVFFFTSNRYGNEDIFWVDAKIIEELRR